MALASMSKMLSPNCLPGKKPRWMYRVCCFQEVIIDGANNFVVRVLQTERADCGSGPNGLKKIVLLFTFRSKNHRGEIEPHRRERSCLQLAIDEKERASSDAASSSQSAVRNAIGPGSAVGARLQTPHKVISSGFTKVLKSPRLSMFFEISSRAGHIDWGRRKDRAPVRAQGSGNTFGGARDRR